MALEFKERDRMGRHCRSSRHLGELCDLIPRLVKLFLGHPAGVRDVLAASQRGAECIQETKI